MYLKSINKNAIYLQRTTNTRVFDVSYNMFTVNKNII